MLAKLVRKALYLQPEGISGEYMIWTDGKVYECKQNTNFSPAEYPQAWE